MPRPKNEDKNQTGSDKTIKPTPRSHIESKTHDSSKEEIRGHETTDEKCDSYNPNIVVNIPPIDDAEAKEANRIARNNFKLLLWTVIINGALCIATISLAIFAYTQSNSSKSAAQIAQNTLDTTRKYAAITLANQKADSKKADDSAKSKYQREISVFNLQIEALNEAKSEFRTTNKPILQVEMTMHSYVMIGHQIDVGEKIVYYGNFPIQFIKETTLCVISSKEPTFDMLKNGTTKDLVSKIATKNTSIDHYNNYPLDDLSPKVTKDEYYAMNKEKKFLFIIGEVLYADLSENKIKKYRFMVKGIDIPSSQPRFIYYNDTR